MPSSRPVLPSGRLAAWYFFYFAYIGAFAPYFTLYLQGLRYSPWDIGVLMSLGPAMRLLAPPLWGWLADRSGRRVAVVRSSAVLSAVGFLAFFATDGFVGVFVGMCVMTFFWSASLPLVETLTLDHLAGRTERYGRIRLWGSVGFIAAVLGVGALLDRTPLATLLPVCFLLLLGIVACAMLLGESMPTTLARPTESLRSGLRRPEVVAVLLAGFFMSAAHGPFYLFFSIHLDQLGYGKTLIGMLWSLGVVAEIGIFLVMPRLSRCYALRPILLACFVLAALRFLVIGWLAESLLLLLLAQVLHGATFGAHHAASVAALGGWFPSGQQARVLALYGSLSFGAGGIVGNLISGEAWAEFGPGWTFTLGAITAAVGWLVLLRGMKRGCSSVS